MSSEAAALLWRHCNVRERHWTIYVRRLEINAGGNIVNFMKYSSFSTPISFEQLPVKSVTKRCSICRYSRFTDIEWASKKRFQQSSEAMGIPIQAWMTNNIALFYATWLLIHVQITMMVSPISFSNSGPGQTWQFILGCLNCKRLAEMWLNDRVPG